MAQTINYLTENNLLIYEDLEKKAQDITDNFNPLSAQIKAAEKRITEIASLKTRIINYSKTREVYMAYRKAGYSKNSMKSILPICFCIRRQVLLTAWRIRNYLLLRLCKWNIPNCFLKKKKPM